MHLSRAQIRLGWSERCVRHLGRAIRGLSEGAGGHRPGSWGFLGWQYVNGRCLHQGCGGGRDGLSARGDSQAVMITAASASGPEHLNFWTLKGHDKVRSIRGPPISSLCGSGPHILFTIMKIRVALSHKEFWDLRYWTPFLRTLKVTDPPSHTCDKGKRVAGLRSGSKSSVQTVR